MIRVKNWSRYQSYKDRRPPWIRFHRSILDDYKYQSMSAESRALLPMLWLLACEDADPTSGLIRADVEEISFRLRLSHETVTGSLHEIEDADFIGCIESVTEPLRGRDETVTPETETEAETETETEGKQTEKPASPAKHEVPITEIVKMYHSLLPNNPRVIKLTEARKSQIKARWKEDLKDIAAWQSYFEKISKSEFLTGRKAGGNGKLFKPCLEWLTKPGNYAKVAEGKYEDQKAALHQMQQRSPSDRVMSADGGVGL